MIKKFIFYLIVINTTLNAGFYDILINFSKPSLLPDVNLKDIPLPIYTGAISILFGTFVGYRYAKKNFEATSGTEFLSPRIANETRDNIQYESNIVEKAIKDLNIRQNMVPQPLRQGLKSGAITTSFFYFAINKKANQLEANFAQNQPTGTSIIR